MNNNIINQDQSKQKNQIKNQYKSHVHGNISMRERADLIDLLIMTSKSTSYVSGEHQWFEVRIKELIGKIATLDAIKKNEY